MDAVARQMTARVASDGKCPPPNTSRGFWRGFRDVRQVRLDPQRHTVNIGFYETPTTEVLAEIESTVQNELAGEWNIAMHAVDASAEFHEHEMGDGAVEFHRSHPPNKPRVIWNAVFLPGLAQPYPHMSFAITASCSCSPAFVACAPWTDLSYHGQVSVSPRSHPILSSHTWPARGLPRRIAGPASSTVNIHFLMIAVAIGALFVDAWTEGATLLFLFSLSNALEQFANYRTRKTIDSLLKVAPKLALRRENSAWVEVPVKRSALAMNCS